MSSGVQYTEMGCSGAVTKVTATCSYPVLILTAYRGPNSRMLLVALELGGRADFR